MLCRSAVIAMVLVAAECGVVPGSLAAEPVAATSQPIQATITGVEGIVQVRLAEDQPWQLARVDMVVGEGAEFRTGPKSAVRFVIPPGQTVTLDRLGTVKVLEAARSAGKIKTDLGMQYGRVRYDIEAAGEEYDSTIRSPGATLAVRGTKVSLTNSAPFAPVATSLTGKARFRDRAGQTRDFGGRDRRSDIESGKNGAAETALTRTFIDPTLPGARNGDEQMAILMRPSVGPMSTGGSSLLGPTVSPGPLPPTGPIDQGSLLFQLVWVPSDDTLATPDLDLFVLSPRGERLGGKDAPASAASGGRYLKDDRGGAAFGRETVVWASSFPLGKYTYEAKLASGVSAEFALVVLKDGKVLTSPQAGTLTPSDNRASYQVDVSKGTAEMKPARGNAPRFDKSQSRQPVVRPKRGHN